MATQSPITLTSAEIEAITGFVAPAVQLRELRRLGFTRARKGPGGTLIVERAHFEAVCAGAIVLPPTRLEKAMDALVRPAKPAAVVAPAPPPVAPRVAAPPPEQSQRTSKTQKITLRDWAAQQYSPAPSAHTLRRWRLEGLIHPAPVFVGRTYFVAADAKHMGDGLPYGYKPLVDRLRQR